MNIKLKQMKINYIKQLKKKKKKKIKIKKK